MYGDIRGLQAHKGDLTNGPPEHKSKEKRCRQLLSPMKIKLIHSEGLLVLFTSESG